MGYAAGATRVRVWHFAWTTVVDFLPLTAAVAYLGSRAQTLSTGDPVAWVAAGVLLSLLIAARVPAVRRRSANDGEDAGLPSELEAGSAGRQPEAAKHHFTAGGEQ